MPLMKAAKIGERFDLAITSSKGMSVTAARELIDHVCGKLGLPLYLLRDFDIAAFSIAKTLTASSRRYRFRHRMNTIVDMGLRFADVAAEGLGRAQPVVKTRTRMRCAADSPSTERPRRRLRSCSMASGGIERDDLRPAGRVRRAQVDCRPERGGRSGQGELAEAYGAFRREANARPAVEAEFERLARIAMKAPSDLEARVKEYLTEQSRRDLGRRRAPVRRGDDLEHKSKTKVALLMVRYMRAFDAADDEARPRRMGGGDGESQIVGTNNTTPPRA